MPDKDISGDDWPEWLTTLVGTLVIVAFLAAIGCIIYFGIARPLKIHSMYYAECLKFGYSTVHIVTEEEVYCERLRDGNTEIVPLNRLKDAR